MKYSLYFFLLFLVINTSHATELELTLPIYHLQIDSVYLEKLYQDPLSNEYFPATFIYDSISCECEIKFRGGTARYLPKKSWALKFNNNDNIFNAERINLNAEYQDRSLMRNYLAMKLFQYFDQPAPNSNYVNLFVNDEHKGVFLQIEEVNEDFLNRNARRVNTLYEAQAHGASMAPLAHYNDYFKNWDKKIGTALNFTDIQMLFNKFYYWKKSDFEKNIESEIDIDYFLTYFAIEFAIVAEDCFTKNFFFFFNRKKNQWEIFPWDNDVTFGNDIRGNYHPSYVKFYQQLLLNNQLLFQRLMEFVYWRNKFWDKVSQVINDGFDYLLIEIDSTYHQIKNDLYQDNNKLGSNSGFDYAVQQIKSFLADRRTFLDGFRYFEKTSLSDYYCSNPFPSEIDPDVIFRVKSQNPQSISVHYIKNFPWEVWAGRYTIDSLQLYDDGNHHDLEAGDLIYGNRLNIAISNSGLIPFCFKASRFDYPANGLFYIECYRTHTMALNVNRNVDNFNQQLQFGRVFKNNNSYLVELINFGSVDIDLSYCHLQTGEYFQNFLLPETTVLLGKDTLILTSNKALSAHYINHLQSIGNFSYDIKLGDTLKLLSPTLSELLVTVCDSFSLLLINQASIVINEINYNSVDSRDVGDWVEFYNLHDFSVDISGWYFKDEDDNHVFVFPENTIINPQGYLVLCQSQPKFHHFFPNVSIYVGDFDFGLKGSGELIRIYDMAGNIVDSLRYDDDPPWPTEPDGSGATLELLNPERNNSLAENWAASTNYGTPGERNSVFTGITKNRLQPTQFRLYQNYPNPFNTKTTIRFELAEPGSVELKIYNLSGQLVKAIKPQLGERSISCNMNGFSSGIYFYYLELNNRKSEIKKAVLLK
jgi:hypothetical protein